MKLLPNLFLYCDCLPVASHILLLCLLCPALPGEVRGGPRRNRNPEYTAQVQGTHPSAEGQW